MVFNWFIKISKILLIVGLFNSKVPLFCGGGVSLDSSMYAASSGSLSRTIKNNGFSTADPKLICYYLVFDAFDPLLLKDLCTHINVGFFEIDEKNLSVIIPEESLEKLNQVVRLKKKMKELKVIMAIGGADSTGFSKIVKTHSSRKKFIKTVMKLMKKLEVDGIDLDWEWPTLNGIADEKIKFMQLLQEFRQFFSKYKKNYILSVDVSSSITISELAYYVSHMADYVSYVIVLGYDYHFYQKWYPFTGHNAPLYSSPNDYAFINVNYSIHYWILQSMPKTKIVLGVPTYGHTYRLYSPHLLGLHSPSTGVSSIGKNGFANYSLICAFTNKPRVVVIWDNISKVPYAYKFPDWISFDNEQSLTLKAVYVKQMKLAGIMIFSVNDDDYLGKCNEDGVPLPLTRKIKENLKNQI